MKQCCHCLRTRRRNHFWEFSDVVLENAKKTVCNSCYFNEMVRRKKMAQEKRAEAPAHQTNIQ